MYVNIVFFVFVPVCCFLVVHLEGHLKRTIRFLSEKLKKIFFLFVDGAVVPNASEKRNAVSSQLLFSLVENKMKNADNLSNPFCSITGSGF